MRTLIVTDLPEIGGSTTVCLTLTDRLLARGGKVAILARWPAGARVSKGAVQYFKEKGVLLYWINQPGGGYGIQPIRSLFRILWEFRPEIYLANGTGWLAPVLAVLLNTRRSYYYYLQHDEAASSFKRLKFLSLVFDHIGAVSPVSIIPLAKQVLPATGLAWLPQYTEPEARYAYCPNKSTGRIKVGFVGALTKSKGIELLITMWRHMRTDGDLLVVGNGPELTKVLAAQSESADSSYGRVLYEGYFDARESDSFFAKFSEQVDFFVCPITVPGDGIPTVILKMLACGVPVITTDLGGM
jgi:glycosyltransferase involved in cell wall biosynthesis